MNRDKQIDEMAKYCETVFPTKGMVGGLPIKIKHDYKAYAELFHNAGYRKASDVAREIIDDLESQILPSGKGLYSFPVITHEFIAELKKKYTKEE